MASIQRIKSQLTGGISYLVQVRVKGLRALSETFPNRKEAAAWGAAAETGIREGRHFSHMRSTRTTFSEVAKRYRETVPADWSASAGCSRATSQMVGGSLCWLYTRRDNNRSHCRGARCARRREIHSRQAAQESEDRRGKGAGRILALASDHQQVSDRANASAKSRCQRMAAHGSQSGG